MMLSKAIDLFIKHKRLQGLQKKTLEDYISFVGKFHNIVGSIDLINLTPTEIEEYALSLYSPERNLSKATIATYLRHLKVFLRFIESNSVVQKALNQDLFCDTRYPLSEVIQIPRTYRRKVDILTSDQLRQLLLAAYEKGHLLKTRNALIIALMVDCGLRREEVVKLTPLRVNLNTRKITVIGKGNKERIVPLGDFTFKLLIEYRKLLQEKRNNLPQDALLLTRAYHPITNNTIKLMISNLQKSTGLNFSAHTLRHNFATNWCIDEYNRSGTIDIFRLQVLMGHQDIQTTQIYVHMAEEIIIAATTVSHLDYIGIDFESMSS